MTTLEELDRRLAAAEHKLAYAWQAEQLRARALFDFYTLPGLRGLWLAGVTYYDGTVLDMTRGATDLTRNGGPLLFLDSQNFAYQDMDGAGDYFSHADSNVLRVTGNESYIDVSVNGLTLVIWARFPSAPAAADGIIGKYNVTGNQREYALSGDGSSALAFAVSDDGTNVGAHIASATSAAVVLNRWTMCWGRFSRDTEVTIGLNTTKVKNKTSIPASIFGGTAAFEIGRRNVVGGEPVMDWSVAALYSAYLSDTVMDKLWERTRLLHGI